MKKYSLLLLFLFITIKYFAQDTLHVLHYNLLNYGLPVYGCDNVNNNPDDKDAYLRTITSYFRPDIFTVNEMRVESNDTAPVDRILDNVLNVHFNPLYKRAKITNLSASHIINMLYFNAAKLTLYAQDVIPAYRDINIYSLYYNSNDLQETEDTAFIHCIVTHLKSSQGEDNEAIRAEMTSSIMQYIETNNLEGSILLMGDFNIYTDQEEAFQNLVNPTNAALKFNDPLNAMGNWHINENFKNVHTQSTHITYNDCASSGGMDDRFDFILLNEDINNQQSHFGYINNSYEAIGNDGSCYDQALLICENSNLSTELKNALYYMSDHLPIKLRLATDKSPGVGVFENKEISWKLYFKNPVKDKLSLELLNATPGTYEFAFVTMMGNTIGSFKSASAYNEINVRGLDEGIYLLHIIDARGNKKSYKIIVLQ